MITTNLSPVAQKVWQVVEKIPRGQTMSYGQVAKLASTSPRAVGRILHNNPNPDQYPCHRVIRSDGTLASGYAFGGREGQRKRLEEEGRWFENIGG